MLIFCIGLQSKTKVWIESGEDSQTNSYQLKSFETLVCFLCMLTHRWGPVGSHSVELGLIFLKFASFLHFVVFGLKIIIIYRKINPQQINVNKQKIFLGKSELETTLILAVTLVMFYCF